MRVIFVQGERNQERFGLLRRRRDREIDYVGLSSLSLGTSAIVSRAGIRWRQRVASAVANGYLQSSLAKALTGTGLTPLPPGQTPPGWKPPTQSGAPGAPRSTTQAPGERSSKNKAVPPGAIYTLREYNVIRKRGGGLIEGQ